MSCLIRHSYTGMNVGRLRAVTRIVVPCRYYSVPSIPTGTYTQPISHTPQKDLFSRQKDEFFVIDILPHHLLFQLSKDLLSKISTTPKFQILDLIHENQELNQIINKSYAENLKVRLYLRQVLIKNSHNLETCNKIILMNNNDGNNTAIFNKAYSPPVFENETQLFHWIIYDCNHYKDYYDLNNLIIKMFHKTPHLLGNEIIFKKIILPNFLLKQGNDINQRDLKFLLDFFKKFPHMKLNVSEINAFVVKSNAIKKCNTELNRKCLNFVFNLNHEENFNQNHVILEYYDSILQDVAISNTPGVALSWQKLLTIQPDLLKHNSYIIYHILKMFKKSRLFRSTGIQMFEKLYSVDFFLKNQSLIAIFLQYSILLNNSTMAQHIITTISQKIHLYKNFNISKYYSQLLFLHLSFNDSAGTSKILSKILAKQEKNVLPPYDLELIIRHILKNNHQSHTDTPLMERKIQESIHLFNKTVKNLDPHEKIKYYTNCYPHIIKSSIDVLKKFRNSVFEINDQKQYQYNINIINELFNNVKSWTPQDKKPPRAFQQSISSLYFDFLTDVSPGSMKNAPAYRNDCLEIAKFNYLISLNELKNKTVAPQNPFNINHSLPIQQKLIVNYSNRLMILKKILKNGKKLKNTGICIWCVKELQKYMGKDSYFYEEKLSNEAHQRYLEATDK